MCKKKPKSSTKGFNWLDCDYNTSLIISVTSATATVTSPSLQGQPASTVIDLTAVEPSIRLPNPDMTLKSGTIPKASVAKARDLESC